MNACVITTTEADYGAGPGHRVTFADCKWHIDPTGHLHVVREDGVGNAASFAPGSWLSVFQGRVTAEAIKPEAKSR